MQRLNKMAAVREIISVEGVDVRPLEIVRMMKHIYKADMSAAMASNYKFAILREISENRENKVKPEKTVVKTVKISTKLPSEVGRASGFSKDDVFTIKNLVDRMGLTQFNEYVNLFA